MVSVVVIAHRPVASALVAAAQHVYSRDPCAASRQMVALDIAPDTSVDDAIAQAEAFVRQADQGQGVLVLTDILGATPGNVAARLARPGQTAVVAGVNLPMLLRALCYGAAGLDELVAKAVEGGTKGVQSIRSQAQSPPPSVPKSKE